MSMLSADKKAMMRNLADRGDIVAQAIADQSQDVAFTVGAEGADGANLIRVTGQIVNGFGEPIAGVQDIIVETLPVSGAGTISMVASSGTQKLAVSTKRNWIQTTAAGMFAIDVLDAAAEDCLVIVTTPNGDTAVVKITFA